MRYVFEKKALEQDNQELRQPGSCGQAQEESGGRLRSKNLLPYYGLPEAVVQGAQ